MTAKSARAFLVTAILSAAAASAAQAACGDRPGTPTNLEAQIIDARRINLKWKNTASERVWWDIRVTDGNGANTGLSLGGVGRGEQGRGMQSSHMFIGLKPGQKLCFAVKARTAPRNKGCVSQLWSGPVCAQTPLVPTKRLGKKTS